jgi:type II secretory pathway component PulJ
MTDNVHHYQNTRQRGFSVIELMIATLLGIFIIGGIIGIFLSSSNNYRLQSALAQVQEKGRFALRKMRIDIQKAGYYIASEEDQIALEWSAVDTVPPVFTPVVATNILSIYRRGDGGTPDTIHRTSYFIDSTDNMLYRNETPDILAGAGVNEPLVADVARLTYRFAADLTSTAGAVSDEITSSVDWIPLGAGVFSAYLEADQLTGLGDFSADPSKAWNTVRSVEVELIVASDERFVVDAPQTLALPNPFDVASSAAAVGLSVDQYFQAYTTTYALRNRVK